MKLKNAIVKISTQLAMKQVVSNMNSTCFSIVHQRKMPEAALKFKK